MFGRIRIGPRLLLLISVQIAISLVIGAMTLTVLNFASTTTEDLNSRVTAQAKLTSLSDGLHEDLLGSVYDVSFGTTTWAEARENVTRARDDFESGWSDFLAGLDADEAEFIGILGTGAFPTLHVSRDRSELFVAESWSNRGPERFREDYVTVFAS